MVPSSPRAFTVLHMVKGHDSCQTHNDEAQQLTLSDNTWDPKLAVAPMVSAVVMSPMLTDSDKTRRFGEAWASVAAVVE